MQAHKFLPINRVAVHTTLAKAMIVATMMTLRVRSIRLVQTISAITQWPVANIRMTVSQAIATIMGTVVIVQAIVVVAHLILAVAAVQVTSTKNLTSETSSNWAMSI